MNEVSVILPTYNKASYLDLTLTGYELQTYKEFEILLVDDGSQDNTREIINKYMDKLNIKYIYQQNAGRSAAKNAALRQVAGEYIIFADDDRIPDPRFVSEHLQTLKKDSSFVTIGSKYEVLSNWHDGLKLKKKVVKDILFRNYEDMRYLLENDMLITSNMLLSSFNKVIQQFLIDESVDNFAKIRDTYGERLDGFYFNWAIATTGNMGLKVPEDEIVFDEEMKGWGGEDNEYAYQLNRLGYKFIFAEHAINYHQYHNRANGEMAELRNNVKYLHKKYPTREMELFHEVFERPYGTFTLLDANEQLRRQE